MGDSSIQFLGHAGQGGKVAGKGGAGEPVVEANLVKDDAALPDLGEADQLARGVERHLERGKNPEAGEGAGVMWSVGMSLTLRCLVCAGGGGRHEARSWRQGLLEGGAEPAVRLDDIRDNKRGGGRKGNVQREEVWAGEDGGAARGALDDREAIRASCVNVEFCFGLADPQDEGRGRIAVPAQRGGRLAGGDSSPEGFGEGELLLGGGDVEWEHAPAGHGMEAEGSLRSGWGNGSSAVLGMGGDWFSRRTRRST